MIAEAPRAPQALQEEKIAEAPRAPRAHPKEFTRQGLRLGAKEAVQQAAMAGFPIPGLPISFTPSLDDLEFLNLGVGPTPSDFHLLCENTLRMTEGARVPAEVEEAEAT